MLVLCVLGCCHCACGVRLGVEVVGGLRFVMRAADGYADSRAMCGVFGGQSNWTVLTSWLLVSC